MMVYVKSAADYLFWGSLLSFIGGFIPYIGGIVSLAGFVIYILGLNEWKNIIDERPWKIFWKIFFITLAWVIVGLTIFICAIGDLSLGATIALAIIIFYPMLIITAMLKRDMMFAFYEKTGVKTFETVGKWVFYGALLTILLVGFIITLIAGILEIIAYNEIPENIEPSQNQGRPAPVAY